MLVAYALEERASTAGVRLNITFEEGGEGVEAPGEKDEAVTNVRPGGSVGAIVTAWQRGADHVRVYADYRNTFKPAATPPCRWLRRDRCSCRIPLGSLGNAHRRP
jgi:hypothetical protein